MGLNRFKFLLSRLRFDDESTREDRWKEDSFAAIPQLFEAFNNNCGKHLVPSDYLSIDETLYPMRTQIGLRQYNPDKLTVQVCE